MNTILECAEMRRCNFNNLIIWIYIDPPPITDFKGVRFGKFYIDSRPYAEVLIFEYFNAIIVKGSPIINRPPKCIVATWSISIAIDFD